MPQACCSGHRKYFFEEDTIVDVHDLFRIVRDGLTIRVIELVEAEMENEGYGYPRQILSG